MKPKKTPLRMCIGCMEMKPKAQLIRVVKDPEGNISLDPTGKKNGRGAYLCRSTACLERSQKAKKLERAFSMAIPETVFQSLKREMDAIES